VAPNKDAQQAKTSLPEKFPTSKLKKGNIGPLKLNQVVEQVTGIEILADIAGQQPVPSSTRSMIRTLPSLRKSNRLKDFGGSDEFGEVASPHATNHKRCFISQHPDEARKVVKSGPQNHEQQKRVSVYSNEGSEEEEKPWQCPKCQSRFISQKTLGRHIDNGE
jgi:hypothetical protein